MGLRKMSGASQTERERRLEVRHNLLQKAQKMEADQAAIERPEEIICTFLMKK